MKRFKTKQEFGPGGPPNWNEFMDAYFGLPWNATGSHGPFPELDQHHWIIFPEHLTSNHHPYLDKEYCVKINTPDQSSRVQKKAFYLGYSWSGSTIVKHTQKSYLHFDDVAKLITYGTMGDDSTDDLEYMILSYQEFMEAAALTPVSHSRKSQRSEPCEHRDMSQLSGTSHPTFDMAGTPRGFIKTLERETKAADAAIHKQSKTTQNGRCIKVQRQTPTVRSGERPDGRRISGRTGKATIRRRSLGNQTITGRI